MRRGCQHPDVRAYAEDFLLAAGQHDRTDLGVLEPHPLYRIVELDVDAEVAGVQLQFVPGNEAAALIDIQRQRRYRPVERQAPVPVAHGVDTEVDSRRAGPRLSRGRRADWAHLRPG